MSTIKRIGKKFLKFIEFYIVPFFGWLLNGRNKFVNVIYYHDIVNDEGFSFMRTNINVFKRQMEWLKQENYETLRFDDLDKDHVKFCKKRILIAFDDGWRSNYTEIFEYMKSQGLKYNIFLTMGEIDNNLEYLTWDMVREMHDSGLCGFGVHTYTHPSMANLEIIDFHHEVVEANEYFKKQMGYDPEDFCYPFGYYSEESNVSLELHTEYQRIYTSKQLYSYNQNNKIVFGRNGISNDDPMYVFKTKVKGLANFSYYYNQTVLRRILSVYHLFNRPAE